MKPLGLLVVALVSAGCACKGSSRGTGTGAGSGPGTSTTGAPAKCDGVAAHVQDLYAASAARTQLTPEEVADNVAMVLAECKDAPDRVVPCLTAATAVAQLERKCLAPLDDQGSEGERFLP